MNFRATPRDGIASPAELLMSRKLNTRLPICKYKLQPARDNSMDYNTMICKQRDGKRHYDRSARDLPRLQPGDKVITCDGDARREARVTGHAAQPRSYYVTDSSGKCLRRNRRHLIKRDSSTSTSSTALSHDSSHDCDSSMNEYFHDTCETGGQEWLTGFDETLEQFPQTPPGEERTERAAAREAKSKIANCLTNK